MEYLEQKTEMIKAIMVVFGRYRPIEVYHVNTSNANGTHITFNVDVFMGRDSIDSTVNSKILQVSTPLVDIFKSTDFPTNEYEITSKNGEMVICFTWKYKLQEVT